MRRIFPYAAGSRPCQWVTLRFSRCLRFEATFRSRTVSLASWGPVRRQGQSARHPVVEFYDGVEARRSSRELASTRFAERQRVPVSNSNSSSAKGPVHGKMPNRGCSGMYWLKSGSKPAPAERYIRTLFSPMRVKLNNSQNTTGK